MSQRAYRLPEQTARRMPHRSRYMPIEDRDTQEIVQETGHLLSSSWRESEIREEDYGDVPTRRRPPPPSRLPGRGRRPRHPSLRLPVLPFLVGAAAFLLLLHFGLEFMVVVSQWQDDKTYGYPRVFQTDAVVGHGDSGENQSHFVAINLHTHIYIIEFPGGSPKAIEYVGPIISGVYADLTPVTLQFRDVNGDGKVDMLVDYGNLENVYLNTGKQFQLRK